MSKRLNNMKNNPKINNLNSINTLYEENYLIFLDDIKILNNNEKNK